MKIFSENWDFQKIASNCLYQIWFDKIDNYMLFQDVVFSGKHFEQTGSERLNQNTELKIYGWNILNL